MEKYVIGEKYWFKNPRAGRGMQSCGTLRGWDDFGQAILFNDRYGYLKASVENLDAHN